METNNESVGEQMVRAMGLPTDVGSRGRSRLELLRSWHAEDAAVTRKRRDSVWIPLMPRRSK